jgi:tetratricopeptide (TPR) repeat protein
MNKLWFVLLITFPVTTYALSLQQQGYLLNEAGKLLAAGQPEQAWQLLSRHEFEYAGEVKFDYLSGMAALATGKYTEATIAFERVLIISPDHLGAQLDSGLAYLKLGNRERALQLFNRILNLNPPENIRVVAQEGVVLASRHADRPGIRLSEKMKSYIAMSVGTDSNVNSSTSSLSTIIEYPLRLELQLNPANTAQSDQFTRINAGMTYQLPASNNSQWELGFNASLASPVDHSEFQNLNTGIGLGYQYFTGDSRWSVGGQSGYAWLDDDDYLGYQGISLGWRQSIDAGNLLDVTTQWTQYRYEQTVMSINDFDQSVVAGRLLHRVDGKPLIASFGLLLGYDDAINASANGDKDFVGASFGLQGQTRFADTGYVSLGFKKSFYRKNNLLYQLQREDSQLDVRAGLTWNLQDYWSINGDVSLTNVGSNIDIYSWQRNTATLTLRKDFSH